MVLLTSTAAQSLHDRITDAGGWVIWIVEPGELMHYGKMVARAMVADRSGGRQEGGDLVADTLDELREMLPAGLTRRERSRFFPRRVVETWD